MLSDRFQSRFLKILFVTGLACAVLSALETRIDWIGSLCSFWGDGCREAANASLFKLPLAVWGIGYYLLLLLVSFVRPQWLFVLVMAGAGVEATLVFMMVSMGWTCVFCIVNGMVVFLCLMTVYNHSRFWQALALVALFYIGSNQLISGTSVQPPPASVNPSSDDETIVAMVGQEAIYMSELDEAISKKLFRLEGLKYELRKKQLKTLVSSRLLELDAADKGLLPEVHQSNILEEASKITDDNVTNYIQNNPSVRTNWKGTEEELRERIRDYLKELKLKDALENASRNLSDKYTIQVMLKPPSLPVTGININEGSSPSMGPADAPVVVYEFSDYQCPTCRRTHKTSVDLRNAFKGKVRWVFKDFPLSQHKESLLMAQAARCAAEQGKFWEYQDYLYTSEDHPDMDTLKDYAQKLDLDIDRFTRCLESGKYKAIIENEKIEAKQAGISRTPTFIINGRYNPGKITYEALSGLIKKELENKH